jgi:predicted outer membrane repeat protein
MSSGTSISSSTFKNNNATQTGGAIYNAGGILNITDSNFTCNKAGTNGGAVFSTGSAVANVTNSQFMNNQATTGGGIYNNVNAGMFVSNNTMKGNNATIGKVIYNLGRMGVLNLTYINNGTQKVKDGQQIVLFANLTDDMGNPITGQNVGFYVSGVLMGSSLSNEGYANFTYKVNGPDGAIFPITGDYNGHTGYNINILNGTLKIAKSATNTTIIVPSDARTGKTTTISGVLTDKFGNTVANSDLTVTIYGKNYNDKTDANGKWSVNYKPTQTGTIDISAKYNGNDDYYGCTNTTNFNVKKGDIHFEITVTENDTHITIT